MTTSTNQLKGFITGATLAYFLDPDHGPRRRGMLRDRFIHLGHKLEDGLDAAARDARNRSVGLAARTRRRFRRDHASDPVIEGRVRSALGRIVSHPGAMDAAVTDGVVTLSGQILAAEAKRAVSRTRAVRGVKDVEDHLEVHEMPANVPGLQGGRRRPGARPELLQENWTPAVRLFMGGLGAAAVAVGRRLPGAAGPATLVAGGVMVARAATNLSMRRLVGLNPGRQTVTLQKSINIDAPVDRVWDVWTRFETLPRFMAHLEEVRVTGDGRSHWVASGPAGSRFQWDAEVTRWVPNQVIAWKSDDGATVASSGVVRFQPNEAGGTRVDVRLSYSPPAGALGHAVASLFGTDPRHAMDEDLLRLKSLLELGRTTANGETLTLETLEG